MQQFVLILEKNTFVHPYWGSSWCNKGMLAYPIIIVSWLIWKQFIHCPVKKQY